MMALNQFASLNAKIGRNFEFCYTNQDGPFHVAKKISPSQLKRNQFRKREYEQSKIIAAEASFIAKNEHPSSPTVITIDIQTQAEDMSSMDVGLNTENRSSSVDNVTQTEIVSFDDVGVNTEQVEKVRLDTVPNVDRNGQIHPKSDNEVLVEFRVNHEVGSREDIQLHI